MIRKDPGKRKKNTKNKYKRIIITLVEKKNTVIIFPFGRE